MTATSRWSIAGAGAAFLGLVMHLSSVSNPDPSVLHVMATWNAIALRTTAAAPINPPREARTMAMVSIAVFDAVNAITNEYTPFVTRVAADQSASIPAAVVAASHDVLAALYPDAKPGLDAARDSSLAKIGNASALQSGIVAGQASARAILALRANDRASLTSAYTTGKKIGTWVKTPAAYVDAMEPGWGSVQPFALRSGSQFRPAPPPQLGSATYVRDYQEILPLGSTNSTTRTAHQTEVARFWTIPAAQLWNQLVRQLATEREMSAASAARAYLLLNVAGADAMIAAWEAKFVYNQWRPVTAIRSAEDDGTSLTATDTSWMPLLETPPFPDYPAGHTAYAGAAAHVLTGVFGATPGQLAMTSAAVKGVTHRYAGFEEISEAVVNARVWAGVHWRTSSVAGRDLGRAVGEYVLARAPAPR